MSEEKFEVLLAKYLNELGFTTSLDFRLKTAVKGKYFVLDLYISSPIRAFVEIKRKKNTSAQGEERLKQRISETVAHFKGRIIPFVILLGDPSTEKGSQFSNIAAEIIEAKEELETSPKLVARHIRNLIAHGKYRNYQPSEEVYLPPSRPIGSNSFSGEKISEAGVVADVLVSFRGLIEEAEFDILRHEISELVAEFESQHYTSGALRIGRALEFVIYTLARSWNVQINKSTLFVLDDLQNALDVFKVNYLNHVAVENSSKPDTKRKVQSSIDALNKKLSALTFNVDNEHQIERTDVIININSILRDMRRHFGRNSDIQDEIDVLVREDLIGQLLNQRNKAAHADIGGSKREVSRAQLKEMIENFREVVFRFSNIANIIASI
jgi:hypothetical protein